MAVKKAMLISTVKLAPVRKDERDGGTVCCRRNNGFAPAAVAREFPVLRGPPSPRLLRWWLADGEREDGPDSPTTGPLTDCLGPLVSGVAT